MRAIAILLVVVLAGGPGTSLATGATLADLLLFAPHVSIDVRGDAGFQDPGSGVVAGSGSVDDPYVIAGWMFVHTAEDAVRLQGTRAHVVLRNLLIPGVDHHPLRIAECSAAIACTGAGGISLVDTENVTVQDVVIGVEPFGVRVVGGGNISLSGIRIGDERVPFALGGYGVWLEGVRGATLERVSVGSTVSPLSLDRARDVRVSESSFTRPPDGGSITLWHHVENVSFERSTFRDVEIVALGSVDGLELARDVFDGGPAALDYGTAAILHGLRVCGSEVRNMTFSGLEVYAAHDARVWGNRFVGNSIAIHVGQGDNVTIEGNEITDGDDGLVLGSDHDVVRGNSFHGNRGEHDVGGSGNDLRGNWWGDPTGPSGDGSGAGEPLFVDPGQIAPFDPWLEAPPTLAVDC